MGPSVVAYTGTLKYKIPINTFFLARHITSGSLTPKSRKAACNKGPFIKTTISTMFSRFGTYSVLNRMGRMTPCLRRGLSRLMRGCSFLVAHENGNLVRNIIYGLPIKGITTTTLRRKLVIVATKTSILHFIPPLIVRGRRISRVVRGLRGTLLSIRRWLALMGMAGGHWGEGTLELISPQGKEGRVGGR